MKIALVSHGPPDDPRHFSGIPWHVLQELRRQGHEVAPIHAEPAKWTRHWAQVAHLFSLKFAQQPHHVEADPWILRTRSARVAQKIRTFAPDAVLCVGFPEAAIALPASLPLYVWMDALYPSVRRLYPYFHIYYSESNARTLHQLEEGVLRHCRKIWLSSEWAASEARADFPRAAAQIGVQSFGANLANPPTSADVEKSITARNLAAPTFLFLAMEWERKGGDTAVETVKRLRAHGCPAKLVVIGLKTAPASVPTEQWIEWVGPLDKNNPGEALMLHRHLAESAFLILPSTADCTPIVCHEAAAYGLPVLATDIGGLPSTVLSGESGMLWPIAKFADEVPAWTASILTDRTRYEALTRGARRHFETNGNWAVNVRSVAAAMASSLS